MPYFDLCATDAIELFVFLTTKKAKLLLCDVCWLSWHNFKDDLAAFLHFVA